MSNLQQILKEVDTLYQELQKLKPLKKDDEERLWKKFRLEWSYNSNHMEGNTLTYGETELLLMFGKITGDHEAREIDEMRAHDAIVQLVKDYAADKSRDLSESDIRQWNKTILVKPFWKEAITADGQPTRKLIEPGNYKSTPNSVRLANGEIFHYASPEDTPIKMQELMEWYKKASIEKKLHPVELAALLHYKFVRIHPFDDSNGRTGRLLMNYVLLKNDYPPVIIKTADKKNYLFALNKADVGDEDAFVEYIAKELMWSLEVNIKAAEGEGVEETDDIDKEIAIWKRAQKAKENPNNSIVKSPTLIKEIYESSIRNLFILFVDKHKQFEDLFNEKKVEVKIRSKGRGDKMDVHSWNKYLNFFDLWIQKVSSNSTLVGVDQPDVLSLTIVYANLKTNFLNKMTVQCTIAVSFDAYFYEISTGTVHKKKNYGESVSRDESKEIVNSSLKRTLARIQNEEERLKNN